VRVGHGLAIAAWLGLGLVASGMIGCGDRPGTLAGSGPYLQLSATQVKLVTVAGAADRLARQITVANGGGGQLAVPELTVRYSGTTQGWLDAQVSGGSSTYTLELRFVGGATLPAGRYPATVSLDAPGAANSPATVAVDLTVGEATMTFTQGPALGYPERSRNAIVLPSGSVLLAGTDGIDDVLERMNPGDRSWALLRRLDLENGLAGMTALSDGTVLMTGGHDPATWEIYDPGADEVVATGSLAYAMYGRPHLLLQDGRVLWASLESTWDEHGELYWYTAFHLLSPATNRVTTTMDYDPGSGRWSAGPSLNQARGALSSAVAVLPGGKVVVAGGCTGIPGQSFPAGQGECGQTGIVEVYDPSAAQPQWTLSGVLSYARALHTLAVLPGGELAVMGGIGRDQADPDAAVRAVIVPEFWQGTAPIPCRSARDVAGPASSSRMAAGPGRPCPPPPSSAPSSSWTTPPARRSGTPSAGRRCGSGGTPRAI